MHAALLACKPTGIRLSPRVSVTDMSRSASPPGQARPGHAWALLLGDAHAHDLPSEGAPSAPRPARPATPDGRVGARCGSGPRELEEGGGGAGHRAGQQFTSK